jgi:hypothetical protein
MPGRPLRALGRPYVMRPRSVRRWTAISRFSMCGRQRRISLTRGNRRTRASKRLLLTSSAWGQRSGYWSVRVSRSRRSLLPRWPSRPTSSPWELTAGLGFSGFSLDRSPSVSSDARQLLFWRCRPPWGRRRKVPSSSRACCAPWTSPNRRPVLLTMSPRSPRQRVRGWCWRTPLNGQKRGKPFLGAEGLSCVLRR